MKVLCVGLMVCDVLVKPVSAEVLKMDTCTAESVDLKVGGDACNVAVNLQGLGADATLLSAVGDDFYGKFILDYLVQKGLDTDQILTRGRETSRTAVLISENGDRCFLSKKGACHQLSPEDVTDAILENFDVLYIGSIGDLPQFDRGNLAGLLARAKRLGLITALDVTGEVDEETLSRMEQAFPYLDLCLPSIREAQNMTGCREPEDCLRALADKKINTVCMKMGAKGSAFLKEGTLSLIPAFPACCVDTTGAGDAFVSGFLAAMTCGGTKELCCRVGNYTGGRAVEHLGAHVELGNIQDIIEKVTDEV